MRWRGWAIADWTEPSARGVRLSTVLLAAVSGAAASIAMPSTLSFDAWSWVIWGREVLAGDLQTEDGPSWKPLPVLITAPLSLFGGLAPTLWKAVAWAGAGAAVAVAASLGRRLAGRLGALLAVAVLLLAPWLWMAIGLANSEGLALLCVLGAVERHLTGHRGQAFALALLSATLRPEALPFVGLYALMLLVEERRRLPWLAAGLLLLPVAWLFPEQLGSGDWFRAARRAQVLAEGSPGAADRPALAVLRLALDQTPTLLAVGFAAAAGAALAGGIPRSARRLALLLLGLGVAWLVVVAAMAEAGFSGIWRYLFVPVAVANVLGAACFAWALRGASARLPPAAATAASLALVVLLAVGLAPGTWAELADVTRRLRYEDAVHADLPRAVARAGGREAVVACRPVAAGLLLVPRVAWELELHEREVDVEPRSRGIVLRTRFPLGGELTPPPGPDTHRQLARTEHWQIEGTCASPVPRAATPAA